MNITIIGTGNMGAPLGVLARQAGHQVKFASRDPQKPVLPAVMSADLVILATQYTGALELADQPAIRTALAGKIVVDLTNPLTDNFMGLLVGHTTSGAEEIARRLPGAKVVKAFNTIFSEVLRNRAEGVKVRATVMVATDDDEARQTVLGLAKSFGLDAVDSGPLSNARYLEPLIEMLIQLAYGKGMGTKISFPLVNALEG
jgi:8-hydroxy-5-deazaflavin:NADPH oxidoreductase